MPTKYRIKDPDHRTNLVWGRFDNRIPISLNPPADITSPGWWGLDPPHLSSAPAQQLTCALPPRPKVHLVYQPKSTQHPAPFLDPSPEHHLGHLRWVRKMKKTLLLCFIHGFKASTSVTSFITCYTAPSNTTNMRHY